MKQVHDANPCSFSPQPYAIAGFFGPQQIIQLLWLREFWRPDSQVERGTVAYAPWYALGNICIGVWMMFWVSSSLDQYDRKFVAFDSDLAGGLDH